MAVADILPPEDKRRYSQTSAQAQKAYQNLEKSRVSQSRIGENPRSVGPRQNSAYAPNSSPSTYRRLQQNLRTKREGGEQIPTGNGRRYGQYSQTAGQIQKPPTKLTKTVILMMLSVSIGLDVTQIILNFTGIGEVLNVIIDVPIELMFFMWFKIRGVSFASLRKVLAFLGTFFLGLATDSIIPTWTGEIALIILAEKAEEKVAAIAPIAKAVMPKSSTGV